MEEDDISESKSKFRGIMDKNGKVNPVEFAIKLIKSAKENHSIEILMFFHMLGMTTTTVIVQNLYIDRICRLDRQFSDDICRWD